jgi:hypothetical protein
MHMEDAGGTNGRRAPARGIRRTEVALLRTSTNSLSYSNRLSLEAVLYILPLTRSSMHVI